MKNRHTHVYSAKKYLRLPFTNFDINYLRTGRIGMYEIFQYIYTIKPRLKKIPPLGTGRDTAEDQNRFLGSLFLGLTLVFQFSSSNLYR